GGNRESDRGSRRGSLVEGAVLLVMLVAVTRLAFFSGRLASSYAVFPLLTWAALRFRQRGATTATLVATAMAVRAALRGTHSFGGNTPTESMEILQCLMSVVGLSGLVLA